MPFNIYPDADTAALLNKPVRTPILLAPGEAMGKFVPLADHVGLDPVGQNLPTTFICIAMSGGPVAPAMQPKFELMAHDPELPARTEAPPLDLNTNVDLAKGVKLPDGVNLTAAGLAFFSPPALDNVYLLKVVTEISGARFWIRITNTTGASRRFVWVAADSEADARQPWIYATYRDATPAERPLQRGGRPNLGGNRPADRDRQFRHRTVDHWQRRTTASGPLYDFGAAGDARARSAFSADGNCRLQRSE